MKRKGMFRFLAVSSHNRRLFPELAKENLFDVFHIRYSAAHRGAESDSFPYLQGENGAGVVSYTATRWGQLLEEKRMPPGEPPPSASDCYRFVLSHPAVDICMTGPRNLEQMREALRTLDRGPMSEDELVRMRKIGDYIRGADR
jgi:aryl-alcohol dehydrogenase-like predicted oxidoreductase